MDVDMISWKGMYEKLLKVFGEEKVDILFGI